MEGNEGRKVKKEREGEGNRVAQELRPDTAKMRKEARKEERGELSDRIYRINWMGRGRR